MKILITGATGFLGSALISRLEEQGHSITVLTRNLKYAEEKWKKSPVECFYWNSDVDKPPPKALFGVNSAIHLAGENVGDGRWTSAKKQRIFDSRVLSTRHLLQGFKEVGHSDNLRILCGSAIGFYGNAGDVELDESKTAGDGFLARVSQSTESEAAKVWGSSRNLIYLRTGMVLGKNGGPLSKMVPAFQWGLGAVLGSGKQWMSWIHIEDWIHAVLFLLNLQISQKSLWGPWNLVSPFPVSQRDFTGAMAESLNRKALFKAPEQVLKILLGEMSTLVLQSQRVLPHKLQEAGFEFKFPDVRLALRDLVLPH